MVMSGMIIEHGTGVMLGILERSIITHGNFELINFSSVNISHSRFALSNLIKGNYYTR